MTPTTLVVLLLCATSSALALTDGTLAELRNLLISLIESDRALIGGLTRLSFHDCVGEMCDGCINKNNPDNAGLEIHINTLETFYSTYNISYVLSRADFWQFTGFTAVEYASQLSGGLHQASLNFKWGREDCGTGPWTSDNFTFPAAIGNLAHVTNFFSEQFGFTQRETVAILGAHTLGRAHRSASGFEHPWVAGEHQLDNVYYRDLADPEIGWHQKNLESDNADRNPVWQWEPEEGRFRQMMLNADMAILKNITYADPYNYGEVSCNYSTCSESETADIVREYANNNTQWVIEFSAAFEKMTSFGYDKLKKVEEGESELNYEQRITSSTAPSTTKRTQVTSTSASSIQVLTDGTLAELRHLLISLIESDRALIGGLTRLSFHDCVGEMCDGCINKDNPDNAGLELYILTIERFYSTHNLGNIMSRADFWQFAGFTAIEYASQPASPSGYQAILNYKWGRVDCATSPWTSEMFEFPDALGNLKSSTDFFLKQFGFSQREFVAIIGAHTLGRAHRSASGFEHPWVAGEHQLDNMFYRDMADSNIGWHQKNLMANNADRDPKWQWEPEEGRPRQMMLNADMAILKNITYADPYNFGEVSCNYSTCSESETADIVREYANNNTQWVIEFSAAFEKMTSFGYDKLNEVTAGESALMINQTTTVDSLSTPKVPRQSLTGATVRRLREKIIDMLYEDAAANGDNQNLRMLGGLVRLAFHDCVGNQCDGCINKDNPDNAGLQIYITILEKFYAENMLADYGITRADFWALAGQTAVIYSSILNTQCPNCDLLIPQINFRWGRQDCPTSPWTSEVHVFPSAIGDKAHVLDFFQTQFGFNTRESVAILGAHTLGRAHRSASGFNHKWVIKEHHLGNEYYVDLLRKDKGWHQVDISYGRENPKWQWENGDGGPKVMMLNADMCLARDMIINGSFGQVTCNYTTCPEASTVPIVREYAENNKLWVIEFSDVFERMTEHGYSSLQEPTGDSDSIQWMTNKNIPGVRALGCITRCEPADAMGINTCIQDRSHCSRCISEQKCKNAFDENSNEAERAAGTHSWCIVMATLVLLFNSYLTTQTQL